MISSNILDHDFYAEATRLLDNAGIPFLVGGAFALRVYTGIARNTKDFDLMVKPSDLIGSLSYSAMPDTGRKRRFHIGWPRFTTESFSSISYSTRGTVYVRSMMCGS